MVVSSADVTDPEVPKQVAGKQVPRLVVYIIGCFCVAVMSGGIILGSGPFATALISEGYVPASAVSSLFVGAYQILTWGTVVAAHLLGRLGPRITALVGICVAVPGIVILAFMRKPVEPMVVTVAYGLIGAGGNHIYLSTFHFAQLFPDRLGLADGVIAGLFNAAGLMLLVLGLPGASIEGIFTVWIFVSASVCVLIVVFYPDKEYVGEDVAVISWPSLRRARNPLNCAEYAHKFGALCNLRYVLFAFSFGSASAIVSWVNGVLIEDLYYDIPPVFLNLAQPLVTNSTVLFTWIVGGLIDRFGFAITGFLQGCFCATLATLTLFRSSLPAAWMSLVCLNWCNSVIFTQCFVFLHMVFPGDVYITSLMTTLVVQALMLFIASPGLTGAFPVDYEVPSLILLGWCALLFVWPVAELLTFRSKDLEAAEDREGLLASRSVLGSIIGGPRSFA